MSQLCGNKEYTLNKAQNVFEISNLGYLVIAYLGYNIPSRLEYPTSAIMPNLLKYLLQRYLHVWSDIFSFPVKTIFGFVFSYLQMCIHIYILFIAYYSTFYLHCLKPKRKVPSLYIRYYTFFEFIKQTICNSSRLI